MTLFFCQVAKEGVLTDGIKDIDAEENSFCSIKKGSLVYLCSSNNFFG